LTPGVQKESLGIAILEQRIASSHRVVTMSASVITGASQVVCKEPRESLEYILEFMRRGFPGLLALQLGSNMRVGRKRQDRERFAAG
jgi:hypothetical protein